MGGKALAKTRKWPCPQKREVGRIFNPFSSTGRHVSFASQTQFPGVRTISLTVWSLDGVGSAQTGSRKLGEVVANGAGKASRPWEESGTGTETLCSLTKAVTRAHEIQMPRREL